MIYKPKYCLLVEDDPEDQEIFLDALHSVSTTVGCFAVSNGEEALNTLIQDQIRPDFIFTDVNMPRMDGVEFLRAIKSMDEYKDIPVIVYTSDGSKKQMETVTGLGASALFVKTRIESLREILRKYLEDPPSSNFS